MSRKREKLRTCLRIGALGEKRLPYYSNFIFDCSPRVDTRDRLRIANYANHAGKKQGQAVQLQFMYRAQHFDESQR